MKDQINPWDDILKTATFIVDNYLPSEVQAVFKKVAKSVDDVRGPLQDLRWQINLRGVDPRPKPNYNVNVFIASLERFNRELKAALIDQDHAFNARKLDQAMVHHIMLQLYERMVSPKVDSLKVKPEQLPKNNTYGELKSKFISDIIQQTKLRAGQVFIDLGSGVGNVVLQMALETGCDSWGWEMMEPSNVIAERHRAEFIRRCRLWRLRPGSVHLERGSFLENPQVLDRLKQADVVLVNNQVFEPDLNQDLKLLFLELKAGCQVVSMKSFGSPQRERNPNDTFNNYEIREVRYLDDWISWTGDGGTYFIATKR